MIYPDGSYHFSAPTGQKITVIPLVQQFDGPDGEPLYAYWLLSDPHWPL